MRSEEPEWARETASSRDGIAVRELVDNNTVGPANMFCEVWEVAVSLAWIPGKRGAVIR